MSKQRFIIFILCIIGLVASFLPWYSVGTNYSMSGVQTPLGWFAFILFGIIILVDLKKKLLKPLSSGNIWAIAILSAFIFFLLLWRLVDIRMSRTVLYDLGGQIGTVPGILISLLYGLWMVWACSIGIILTLIFAKDAMSK